MNTTHVCASDALKSLMRVARSICGSRPAHAVLLLISAAMLTSCGKSVKIKKSIVFDIVGFQANDVHGQITHDAVPTGPPGVSPIKVNNLVFPRNATANVSVTLDTNRQITYIDITAINPPLNPGDKITGEIDLTGVKNPKGNFDQTFWTFNGVKIGGVAIPLASVIAQPNPDGTVTVSLSNSSPSALAYSGLAIYLGADVTNDTGTDLAAWLSTGTPLASSNLLVASSGMFPPGITPVAVFTPSSTTNLFDGGFATIDGDPFVVAAPGGSLAGIPGASLPVWSSIGFALILLGTVWRFSTSQRNRKERVQSTMTAG